MSTASGLPTEDLASKLLGTKEGRSGLEAFFTPQNIAVIGATEKAGSIGRTIVWNLMKSPFGGPIFPVNPKRRSVLGIKAHPRIGDVPDLVDLAIVVTPAPTVPDLIGECVKAGVRAAIVASAGFKEVGAEGAALERRIMDQAGRGRMRVIGPNSLGVMSPFTGLNATAANAMARPGKIAFLSQSGALGTAVLDWSLRANVGFSAFVSVGSQLDVGWGDLIDYLGNDLHTKSIIIYMESIGDARSFLSAAREVALTKPIIVIKPGRTEEASQAAASHTGSMTGSDEVLDAAFRRCGVLRVDRISELFSMAEILNTQPRLRGPRLAILTNAGGPGVLATDALIVGGGQLAPLAPESLASLNRILPPPGSDGNPVDLVGDASPDRYARALEVVAKDPNTDGVLVILTPHAMTDPTQTAEKLKAQSTIAGKPVLASWMGGDEVAAGESILNRAGIPSFPYPDTAARAFNHMWRYSQNIRSLYETPALADGEDGGADRAGAEDLIASVLASGRTVLTEAESKRLLELYRIPVVPTRVAATEEQAVAFAAELGYPAVLKLYSQTITHKTDVGGVRLNLSDGEAVRHAYCAIEQSVRRRVGAEHFLGVTVQPMIEPRRLRDRPRLQPRSAVRPGAPVRRGRATGRTAQGPYAGPAAAEHNAGAADDGAHLDLPFLAGDPPRSPSRRSGRVGAAAGPVQWAGGRTAAGQGDRHQPAARLARAADRAGRPGGPARGGGRCEPAAPPRHPPLSHPVRRRVDGPGRSGRHDPPDPARGRAVDSAIPREAVREHRLPALLPVLEAEPAHRPRAADPDLLHRLQPRDGAGGRLQGPRDRGTRDHRRGVVEPTLWRRRGRVLPLGPR